MEGADLERDTFIRFFDNLSPGLDHQVSLGQSNTVCLCPAFTSHSELDEAALKEAGISPTTIRIAVGLENPKEVIGHFQNALRLTVDPMHPGFSSKFLDPDATDELVTSTYMAVHRAHVESGPGMRQFLS